MLFNSHQKPVLASPHSNTNSYVCLPRGKADEHLTFGLVKKPLSLAFIFREDFLNPSSFLLAFQEPRLEDSDKNILHHHREEFNLSRSVLCWKVVMGLGEENRSERCREFPIQCLMFRVFRFNIHIYVDKFFFSGLSWEHGTRPKIKSQCCMCLDTWGKLKRT